MASAWDCLVATSSAPCTCASAGIVPSNAIVASQLRMLFNMLLILACSFRAWKLPQARRALSWRGPLGCKSFHVLYQGTTLEFGEKVRESSAGTAEKLPKTVSWLAFRRPYGTLAEFFAACLVVALGAKKIRGLSPATAKGKAHASSPLNGKGAGLKRVCEDTTGTKGPN